MTKYRIGEWYGIVTPTGVAMLPPGVPATAVERVWLDLRADRGLGTVIDGLISASGAGLSGLPDFGLVVLMSDGAVRVAMRGAVSADLWMLEAVSPEVAAGTGVTTWNERTYAGVARVELGVDNLTVDDPAGGELLPIVDGVLRAALIDLSVLESETQPPEPSSNSRPLPPVHVRPPAPSGSATGTNSSAVRVQSVSVLPPARSGSASDTDEDSQRGTEVGIEVEVSQPRSEVGQCGLEIEVPRLQSEEAQLGPAEIGVPPPGSEEEQLGMAEIEVPQPRSALADGGAVPPDDEAMFGDTMIASAESAAVRAAEPDLHDEPDRDDEPTAVRSWSDHDGSTIMAADLLRAMAEESAGSDVGRTVAPEAVAQLQPVRLMISGRTPVVLERGAIIGTRPRLDRIQGGAGMPQLIAVPSPNSEISRNHLELRVEGSAVLAIDLNSTNGRVLLRPGSAPTRMPPGEPSILVAGDQLDLGDGLLLAFEGLR